ncbi:cyclin-J [Leptodactylus fuscus]|uniref:cyclin-J n=1 Tax=Leptodactylus fuscus TaxID=238119 RepID=UPI003F4EA29D
MELEGLWWKGQLAADIHQALRYKELKLPTYKGQSPQLNVRRYFADLIAIVSNRFKLCPTARHLAVYLLDLFMDRYDISIQQLHIVSLSCLLLASKFEDKEDRVPKLDQLNSLGCMTNMNLVLTKQNLLHMELLLLETFQWNLCLPTPSHFIEYYLSIAVIDTDLHDGWPMICLEKTKIYMAKYADYFLEVSLQDHMFLTFLPSLVAAACIAASRMILRLMPSWPTRFHRLTAYSWDVLVPCIERLLVAHDNDVKEASKHKSQLSHAATPCLFPQSPAPPQTHVQQHMPHFLHSQHQLPFHHQPAPQQPSCQQIVSAAHTSAFPLQTCSSVLTSSVQSRAHIQTAASVSLAAVPLEVKPCIGVSYNRNFPVNGHYSCVTQCFER